MKRSYLKRVGKQTKKTNSAVARWKRKQRPNHEGYYVCYLCGKWVTYLMAEHVKSKARRPDQRTSPDNFKPVCESCNEKKGSKNA